MAMSARNNPFEEIERLFDRLSRQFDEASRKWEFEGPTEWWATKFEPMAVDLVEHDDEFVVTVDLPGFERDEVDIKVTDQTLRIDAEHGETTEEEEAQYIRHERRHESARRTIRLPDQVDAENVKAQMKNGVLTITLPRLEPEKARKIEIE